MVTYGLPVVYMLNINVIIDNNLKAIYFNNNLYTKLLF